jgi:hypothetical protein
VKIVDVKQGSAEWVQARIGLPTASCFDQIVTPAKGERSKSMNKYLARLFAEWYLNAPMDDANSGFMERGTALESQAAGWYGLMHDVEVHKVGLCLRDDGKAGASPDGLVGENGLVEIKCLGAQAHAEALIAGGSQNDYRVQVQGQLYITEALANQSPGAPVNVQFVVHGPVVNGAIVRIDDAGTGIAFRGLNSSQKKLISEWVKQVTEQGDASPRNQAAWNSES